GFAGGKRDARQQSERPRGRTTQSSLRTPLDGDRIARLARPRRELLSAGGRGGRRTIAVCPLPQRRLAGLAGGPVRGPRPEPELEQLPGVHARDVRLLSRGARGRAQRSLAGAGARDPRRARGLPAGPAAYLAGRFRLSRL